MRFLEPLIEGRLIRRYKRFLADVALPDGQVITAHVPNSGAMTGLDTPESVVWLSRSANPKRKLAHTLELVMAEPATGGGLVGVNTMIPNRLVADAIGLGALPELTGYAIIRREVAYGAASKIDILLEDGSRPPAHVEIKSVTLRRAWLGDGLKAEFPDCPTARGAKHLEELTTIAQSGGRAVMMFVVQRMDCARVGVARDIDPKYAAALDRAMSQGVEVTCRTCAITPEGIELAGAIPFTP